MLLRSRLVAALSSRVESMPTLWFGWRRGLDTRGKNTPLSCNPLESVFTAILELDPRAGRKILYCARNQDLIWLGKGGDSRPNVDSDSNQLAITSLTFTCMKPATHFESQAFDRIPNGCRAPNRASSPIERDQEPIAGRIDFVAAGTPQLLAHGSTKVL